MGRLSFELFPPQEELYSEVADAEEVTILKSTQVGVTAYAWRWAARQVDTFGDTGKARNSSHDHPKRATQVQKR